MKFVLRLTLAILTVCGFGWGEPPSDVPVDIEIPFHPIPVKAHGQLHLLYELHLTNFHSQTQILSRVDVDAETGALAQYTGEALSSLMAHPGAGPGAKLNAAIPGGTRAIVFLDVTLDGRAAVPQVLSHQLCFKTESASAQDKCVEHVQLPINSVGATLLAAPLRGSGWVALNGLSNHSSHRRTLVVVNGKIHLAQRFATDWSRIGPDGLAYRGDPSNLANWSPYGADVLAVADAVVADTKDGIPDNNPASDTKAVPIDLKTVGGNYLILDLRNGFFTFYAHLKPGSLRVKTGDRVRRGQVIASLGNSGNSDAPHLHFHVSDGNSPLGAEGVPYVLDSFVEQGLLLSKTQLASGGWHGDRTNTIKRQRELPVENAVITFP
jgi:murein DD-endopeptidase MepM/ murein hydrolase activator NlpD